MPTLLSILNCVSVVFLSLQVNSTVWATFTAFKFVGARSEGVGGGITILLVTKTLEEVLTGEQPAILQASI